MRVWQTKTYDMTDGSPAGHIIRFAIPLLLGNLSQQLYALCDTYIISHDASGVSAVAAIGATGSVSWLVIGTAAAFSQGLTLHFSKRIGAKDGDGFKKALATSILILGVLAPILSLLSVIAARWLLVIIKTPSDILSDSMDYISIVLCAMPMILFGNFFAGVLRALGNTRTPLVVQICASLINIALDVLFVYALDWGIVGVAVATALGHTVTCCMCLVAVLRVRVLRTRRADWRPDKAVAFALLRLGVPMGFMNLITAVGSIMQQNVANAYGTAFVAGLATGHHLCAMIEQPGNALAMAVCSFIGQNLGAGRRDRVMAGLRFNLRAGSAVAACIAATSILFGKPVAAFFITDAYEGAVKTAADYLMCMGFVTVPVYMLFAYSAALQGMQNALGPMLISGAELAVRVAMILILPYIIGEWGVYLTEALARACAFVLAFALWRRTARRWNAP